MFQLTATNFKIYTLVGDVVTASSLVAWIPSGGVTMPLVGVGLTVSSAGKLLSSCIAYPDLLDDWVNKSQTNTNIVWFYNKVAETEKLFTSKPTETVKDIANLTKGMTIIKDGVKFVRNIGYTECNKLLKQGAVEIVKLAGKRQFRQLLRLGLKTSAQLFIPSGVGIVVTSIELLVTYSGLKDYISSYVGKFTEKIASGIKSYLERILAEGRWFLK